jgi:hypothetical protein
MSDIENDELDYEEDVDDVEEQEVDEERFADSFRQHERATHGDDEGWKDLHGRDYIGDYPIYQTPEQIFRADVMQILQGDLFDLHKQDKRIIVGNIDKLHWKLYKIPKMYVAGYYLNKHKLKQANLDAIQKIVGDDLYQPIKYSRYWANIL